MKNKFLSLLFIATAALFLHILTSCSGIFSVPDTPDEQGTKAAQEQRYTISGSFSLPNASAAPAEVNAFQNQANPRNAMPDTSITALKYIVKAVRTSDGQEESTESSDGKTYLFDNLTAGSWQITAYAYTKDSNAYLVMQSEAKSISISAENPYASASLLIAPSSGGTGDINLTISWDSANCGIGYCKMVCTSYTPLSENISGSSVTKALPGVPSGIHELKLSFYSSYANASAGMPPLYECTEYLSVLPHLTTNRWTAGSAPHINSSGAFNVTKTCTETFVYRKIYVAENGNDSGTGTSERPFATIQKAMNRLNEVASHSVTKEAISATTPWELHVIGCPTPPSSSISGNGLIVATSNIQFLKIVGDGEGAKIDANGKGRILYVKNGATVSMQNIELTNGSSASGSGVTVVSGGSFTMESGSIKSCTTSGGGGGIYSEGSLTIQGGTISGNSSNNNAGGGVIALGGSVNITGGSIKGNTSATGGNNIYINSLTSVTALPAGNESFYDDNPSTSNGRPDAVCNASGHCFMRFNKPNDTQNYIGAGINNFTSNATIYLGQTDASSSEWKTSNLEIGATCNYNLTIRPTKTGASAKIMYASDTQSTDYLIHYNTNSKTLTLTNLILDGNSKKCGIVKVEAGTLSASNCTFQNGQAENGGGLHIKAGASATLTSCTIDSCRAEKSNGDYAMGGGIYTEDDVTFSGTIQSCSSKGFGGGVAIKDSDNAKFKMTGGTISSCIAESISTSPTGTGMGGGIFTNKIFIMEGGTITNCTAYVKGSGVFVSSGSEFHIKGNASLDSRSEVYLPNSKTIKITDSLNPSVVATIKPESYPSSSQVFTVLTDDSNGTKVAASHMKFKLVRDGYCVNKAGIIKKGYLAETAPLHISSMTATETVNVIGDISAETIANINTALKTLYANNPSVRVTLDLSETTGLTELPNMAFATSPLKDPNTNTLNPGCFALKGIVLPYRDDNYSPYCHRNRRCNLLLLRLDRNAKYSNLCKQIRIYDLCVYFL